MNQKMTVTKMCGGMLVIASFLLTNCATGPQFTTSTPPPSGKALVYVYRKGSMVGAAGYSRIYVNDDFLAALHNAGYAPREVPQGTVVFTTLPRVAWPFLTLAAMTNFQKKQHERLRIEVEAGKTYYIKWSIGDKMKLVDPTTGAKEMNGLHLATEKE